MIPMTAKTIMADLTPAAFPQTVGKLKNQPINPPTRSPPPRPISKLHRSMFPVENFFIREVITDYAIPRSFAIRSAIGGCVEK